MVTDTSNQAIARAIVPGYRGETTDDTKVTFDEKQQARVNELIREKQGEAARAVRAELDTLKTQHQQMMDELASARAALASAGTKKEKEAAKDDLEALRAQLAEHKNLVTSAQAEVERFKGIASEKEALARQTAREKTDFAKRVELQVAATKAGFVDVADAVALVAGSVEWDEARKQFVVKENGTERLNSTMAPMTLEEYMLEFAAKKPYLVRANVTGGTGATGSTRSDVSSNGKHTAEQIFGKNSNAALANKLAKENYPEYKRLKGVAQANGLI